MVTRAGGVPLMNKTGHAFMKERMRSEDAVYGGEMSAHHYFREFAYCDSGMLPWLRVVEEMSTTGRQLSDLVQRDAGGLPGQRRDQPPPARIRTRRCAAWRSATGPAAVAMDRVDGLSLDMGAWRFNLRQSNTEPVIRLNVESRGDQALMESRTREILAMLDVVSAPLPLQSPPLLRAQPRPVAPGQQPVQRAQRAVAVGRQVQAQRHVVAGVVGVEAAAGEAAVGHQHAQFRRACPTGPAA